MTTICRGFRAGGATWHACAAKEGRTMPTTERALKAVPPLPAVLRTVTMSLELTLPGEIYDGLVWMAARDGNPLAHCVESLITGWFDERRTPAPALPGRQRA
jgi:hypothetical protein